MMFEGRTVSVCLTLAFISLCLLPLGKVDSSIVAAEEPAVDTLINNGTKEAQVQSMMRRNQQEPATLPPSNHEQSMEVTSSTIEAHEITTISSTVESEVKSGVAAVDFIPTKGHQKDKVNRRVDNSQSSRAGQTVSSSGGPTVLQILNNLRASTFVQLLRSTRLDSILDNTGPYTVFAPTDEAFNRLPNKVQKRLQTSPEKLLQVLHYHIVPGMHEFKHLGNGLRLATMATDNASVIVRVHADKKPTINSAALTVPDARASNGVVHIVSDVIYPLPIGTIMATLRTCPALSTLVGLLESSGLGEKFDSVDEGITLLAPSEDAFRFLSKSHMDALKNNATFLQDLLLNHVIPGVYFSGSLRDNQLLITGTDLDVHVAIHNGRLREANIARVTRSDIPATNGVIHIVDRLLLSDEDSCFDL